MDDQNKNLLLATVLSFLVILVWFVVFPPPEPAPESPGQEAVIEGDGLTPPPAPGEAPGEAPAAGESEAPDETADTPRLAIETPRLTGTISLMGGRLDDLSLRDYRETLDEDSPIVQLLKPVDGPEAFYAIYGWAPGGALDFADVPGPNTEWSLREGETLAPGRPLILEWENARGMTFLRRFEVDDNYMFSVTQSVVNSTEGDVRLAPYGIIARHGEPSDTTNFFILHEGMLQMSDGTLNEDSYSNMTSYRFLEREGANAEHTEVESNGWIGFTDKYWMATLIPQPGQPFTAVSRYVESRDVYQTRVDMPAVTLAPGAGHEVTTMLFAGAKEWTTIRNYQNDLGIDRFVDSIDWGWFFFLTKPIFAVLYWINGFIGNMGWSIIALTFIIKAVLLPLAWKSYVSMAKMKELQPEMQAIKERAGDDRQKLQQEMVRLYKEKKVNPAAGCLPILLQIPIFFSLYKVIFVTIELRHAPWFGVFQDLSAPDPTSLMNLFGLLPWGTPDPNSIMALIFIGILPILLGVSMWLQMRLNPAPPDKTQAMIFNWMPWVFMFILGGFASGLVLYWIANNVITFSQQYLIMRSTGHKPDLLGNIRSSLPTRKSKDSE
ncbi:membrane protein insertase YidC [Alkalilacustris brevis]|uniref:membrane protein insertase YidC n=1 Tax=Alkalilacustris brevis TaxID=2026338 RepID=UPI000E0DCEB3|nr:membrane protein insertase YidC [Alkalilacustris brevis]